MRFKSQTRMREVGFQIAPMVDIFLFLLCFFVTTQILATWEMEVDIKLPTAQTAVLPQRLPGEIIVNITQSGEIVVNGRRLDEAGLVTLLNRIVKMYPGQPVLIRADKATAYEHVISVLDKCRRADIWNISFATAMTQD